jgi:hypothetical protein
MNDADGIFLAHAPTSADVETLIRTPVEPVTTPSLVFILANAEGWPLEHVRSIANALIDVRCAALLTWGPGSPRLDVAFAGESGRRQAQGEVVEVGWGVCYRDKPLDDALFFALIVNCAGTCFHERWYDELPRRILIIGDAVSESEVVAAIRAQIGNP